MGAYSKIQHAAQLEGRISALERKLAENPNDAKATKELTSLRRQLADLRSRP